MKTECWIWRFWVPAGLAGVILFILFFNHAFPSASIELGISRPEVIKRAAAFLREQGFDTRGFDRTIFFNSDYTASVFLQKTLGIKRSNELIRAGMPVWFWSVRWFKELEKEGFTVDVDPAAGNIVNFYYSVLDDAPGDDLAPDEAQETIEGLIRARGIEPGDYELKQNTTKKQKNRTDHFLEWQKKNQDISGAHLRLSASLYGSRPGYLRQYLYVPEAFVRQLKKEIAVGDVLAALTMIFMFLIFIAAAAVLFRAVRQNKVSWKFGFFPAVVVAGVSLAAFFNSMPLLWAVYPNTESKAVFVTIAAAGAVLSSLLTGLVIFLFGASGEFLAGETSMRMPILEAMRAKRFSAPEIMPALIVGYCLGGAFLGYITLFYLAGTKFFPVWMPPQAEYSNILATSFPFLFPLTVALSAAVSEEFMFRLFSVPFFRRFVKPLWPAVLIPAVIWAFAHSQYPVFPAYVRGIELTFAGVVFGLVFLRYGLEAVLIAHFAINAALAGLPLIKSGNLYFMISGIVTICLLALPAAAFAVLSRRRRRAAADISRR